MTVIELLKSSATLKKIALWMLQPPMRPKPRLWVRLFINPLVHKKGKHSLVRFYTRMDVFPFNQFSLGEWSTIEDFSCINNAMGPVIIGNQTRIGLSNTIIGPVTIGNNVNIAQHVVMSGLNHGYEDINVAPRSQKCSTAAIHIEDDCWIGANVVVTAGVTIGKHCVIAAGSVVTKNIPEFSIVAGNPAKIIKHYNGATSQWEKVSDISKNQNYGKAA
ncbi:MAG: acyltransferase [Bacteroidetes bacterium]|nr:acyltransferase [Bacteroidota bacterium]